MKPLNATSLKNGRRSIYQSVESRITVNDLIMNGNIKLDVNVPHVVIGPKDQFSGPIYNHIPIQRQCTVEVDSSPPKAVKTVHNLCKTEDSNECKNETLNKMDIVTPNCARDETVNCGIKKPTFRTDSSKQTYLTTDKMYYLPNYFSVHDDVNKDEEIKVPSFTYNPIPSFYKIEGTEDLDERVFQRRHQKYEQEEKRRKRWDMQRIREQRIAQKLRQKYNKGESSQTNKNYFCPDISQLKYIDVINELPVIAFGHPIPKFEPSEFSTTYLKNKQPKSTQKKGFKASRKE